MNISTDKEFVLSRYPKAESRFIARWDIYTIDSVPYLIEEKYEMDAWQSTARLIRADEP